MVELWKYPPPIPIRVIFFFFALLHCGALPPLTTCACDLNSLTQSWITDGVIGEPGTISSVADPSQCWNLMEEHEFCDGPCVVLSPCTETQVLWTAYPDPDGGVGVFFQATDFNASRDDDGWCMQQNRQKFEIQLWGCDVDNVTKGEPWVQLAATGGVAMVDTWRPEGSNECICASATPSPSPSPGPLPPPIHTCE
jgi:hypothetical protein